MPTADLNTLRAAGWTFHSHQVLSFHGRVFAAYGLGGWKYATATDYWSFVPDPREAQVEWLLQRAKAA
jgi:hypothetical protein